jgi:hypothetical protein
MTEIEIKGGANEFEAAVVAVVIDRIKREEIAARQGRRDRGAGLSAWVRAIGPEPVGPRDLVWPEW